MYGPPRTLLEQHLSTESGVTPPTKKITGRNLNYKELSTVTFACHNFINANSRQCRSEVKNELLQQQRTTCFGSAPENLVSKGWPKENLKAPGYVTGRKTEFHKLESFLMGNSLMELCLGEGLFNKLTRKSCNLSSTVEIIYIFKSYSQSILSNTVGLK